MVADLAGPAYKFELSSPIPSIGMVRMFLHKLCIHIFFKIFIDWVGCGKLGQLEIQRYS